MLPSTDSPLTRLVGLITVLLVVVAISTVLALNTHTSKQKQFSVKTVQQKTNFGRDTKHIPPEVTTTTSPVLVRVRKIVNTLSILFPTTTTSVARPVAAVPQPRPVVVSGQIPPVSYSAGTYNGYPCGGDLPNCCTLRKESGGHPDADNGVGYTGLWQFSNALWGNYHGYSEAKYAPWQLQNEKARYIVSQSGYRPWYGDHCYPGG